MKHSARLAAVVLLVGVAGASAQGTVASPGDERVLNEIRQLRELLEQVLREMPRRPVESAEVSARVSDLGKGRILGDPAAPVTILEYADLQCPYCRLFHTATYPRLKADYIDTGKVRYVVRDYPLSIHPMARSAAHAARCAGEQNKFPEMWHATLTTLAPLTTDAFVRLATNLRLDVDSFKKCVGEPRRYDAEIDREIQEAIDLGVQATPSFVIGRSIAGGVEGTLFVGNKPFSTVEAQIKRYLEVPKK